MPSPRTLFADIRTKYGSPVSSSVIVYHCEGDLARLPLLEGEEDAIAGIVVERRVDGLRPRTELPKCAVKFPLDPTYGFLIQERRKGAGV